MIAPNSFQSLVFSQKRASSWRDGFIEITLTDSHLLSLLRQLAPDAQSGRHDPISLQLRASIHSHVNSMLGRLDDVPGPCELCQEEMLIHCFPPYPAHGPQDASGKEGNSLNSSPKFTRVHYVKTPRKNAKSQHALGVAQRFPSKDASLPKKANLAGGWTLSEPRPRQRIGGRVRPAILSPRKSARTAFTSHSPRPAKPDSSRSSRGGVPIIHPPRRNIMCRRDIW